MTEQFTNNAQTTVTSGLNNTTNPVTFLAASAAGFPTSPNFRILVDNELMLVTAVSGVSWTVSRGVESTTIAAHANGATVTEVLTAASLAQTISEQITAAIASFSASLTASLFLSMAQEFRLSLESATPASTTDQENKDTIYCTPCTGNRIALYDGVSQWTIYATAQFSKVLTSLSTLRPYDVFCYANAGVPTLEFLAWTDDTTRATSLSRQDGVLVKSGATTRRYLGTFFTVSASTTTDSKALRLLWNYYNRIDRHLVVVDETDVSYAGGSPTFYNSDANNHVSWVQGVIEDTIDMHVSGRWVVGGFRLAQVGIGVDDASAFYKKAYVETQAEQAGASAELIQLSASEVIRTEDILAGKHSANLLYNADSVAFRMAAMSMIVRG